MIKNYLEQLYELSNDIDVPLLKVFIKAGVPTSTYYRTIKGETQLKYETAVKVAHIMNLIAKRQARKGARRS